MNPIVEHIGKALIAKNKGDKYEEGRHLELAMGLAEDLSTDAIMNMQDLAIRLIYTGEIK
jgi:hypothetical protein